jgi:hypothetical protein
MTFGVSRSLLGKDSGNAAFFEEIRASPTDTPQSGSSPMDMPNAKHRTRNAKRKMTPARLPNRTGVAATTSTGSS